MSWKAVLTKPLAAVLYHSMCRLSVRARVHWDRLPNDHANEVQVDTEQRMEDRPVLNSEVEDGRRLLSTMS